LRFSAAAARKIDTPSLASWRSRSFSSSVQGFFRKLTVYPKWSFYALGFDLCRLITAIKKTAVPRQIKTAAFLSAISGLVFMAK
jgi:hypothetical protein